MHSVSINFFPCVWHLIGKECKNSCIVKSLQPKLIIVLFDKKIFIQLGRNHVFFAFEEHLISKLSVSLLHWNVGSPNMPEGFSTSSHLVFQSSISPKQLKSSLFSRSPSIVFFIWWIMPVSLNIFPAVEISQTKNGTNCCQSWQALRFELCLFYICFIFLSKSPETAFYLRLSIRFSWSRNWSLASALISWMAKSRKSAIRFDVFLYSNSSSLKTRARICIMKLWIGSVLLLNET